jgi:hypothetical protein
MKPTVQEIEEYMASLNIPDEQRFNGTATEDIVKPEKTKKGQIEQYLKYKNVFLEREEDFNVISKPKHYMLFDEMEVKEIAFEGNGVEVRDVIEKLSWKLYQSGQCSEVPLFISDYVQLMQYLMRFMDKNGKEDLEKARWYLDKMISSY